MSRRSMLTFSTVLAFIGIGFYFLQLQVIKSEFNFMPSYDVILKSPDFNLVTGKSVEDFFIEADDLKEQLDQKIKTK